MKKVLSILCLIILLCTMQRAVAQDVNIAGRNAAFRIVFDDTVLADVTKVLPPRAGHSGWISIDDYQFFAAFITLTPDVSFLASGLDTGSIYITYETHPGDTAPVVGTTGYYRKGTTERDTLATFAVADTVNCCWVQSFHGTADPILPPSGYVRFYSSVSGALPDGVGIEFILKEQP